MLGRLGRLCDESGKRVGVFPGRNAPTGDGFGGRLISGCWGVLAGWVMSLAKEWGFFPAETPLRVVVWGGRLVWGC